MSNNNNSIINNKYLIQNKIGNGNFGTVFSGININSNKPVAIKVENSNGYTTIKNEATLLRYLQEHKCYFIPLLFWYGKLNDNLILVIPKYDCSIHEYILNNDLSLTYIDNIMLKMISVIETIHTLFIVHRDIKPHHFMIKNNDIFLIDFGLATFYINDNKTIKNNTKTNNTIIGSPNYVSYFIHEGNIYSRRDDLISIGYIYYFMNTKTIPWDYVNNMDSNKDIGDSHINNNKNIERKNQKDLTYFYPLCIFINNNFATYIKNCYSLEYYDEPIYDELIALFHR